MQRASIFRICATNTALIFGLLISLPAAAQGVVDFNVNVTGTCAPGYDCGQPGRQQNEPSCKANPLNELNQICAYNDYSLADLPDRQGDTVIGFSETRDGRTFMRRLLTGTRDNFWNGQDFMADPTVMVSEGFAAVTSIAGIRSGNSIMQIQRMMELNTETGFRYISEAGQHEITSIQGSNFIDKPDARIIPHPDGGTELVTMTLEDGTTVTRELPRVRIVVTFAVFNGSQENIRTFVTYSDGFGAAGTWSNPKQISQTSGLDQGLSVASIGNRFLYVMRRFGDSGEPDSLMGAIDNDAGARPGKIFTITGICPFDQVTLPDPFASNAVSFRTNDFPWVSATANEFVLVYSERPRDAAGNCVDQGSRVMVRTSPDGKRWSDAVEVSPVTGHAFQFMQSIDCTDDFCQALWYDTRNESLAFEAALGARADKKHWEENPYIEDFDVHDNKVGWLRFRRSADVYTNRIRIVGGKPVPNAQPERVSRYIADNNGLERESNLMNIRAFGGNTVPFNGDYIAITALNSGNFFGAWTDWRRARGRLVGAPFTDPTPYVVPESIATAKADEAQGTDATRDSGPMPASPGEPFPIMLSKEQPAESDEQSGETAVAELVADAPTTTDRFQSAYMPRAEGLVDENPMPNTCTPTTTPVTTPFNTRTKDSEIFGAVIEDRVRLVSPTTSKNYDYCAEVDPSTGNCVAFAQIQRTFVLGINNDADLDREFTLVIANQPGNPVQVDRAGDDTILVDARASWRQLPFGPVFDPEIDPAPIVVETLKVPGRSFDYITLFVVSKNTDNPVTVLAYDDTDTLVAEITVNGISAAGDLIDPGVVADVRIEEVHNPELIQPDWGSLTIEPLNPAFRNPAFRNPAFRNPAFRNPAFRNEAYGDSSLTDPEAIETDSLYEYELRESTEMLSSSLRNPALRNESETDSFVDVTFGVEGDTNTISAYNADFAFAGEELNQLDTQLIAWNTNNVDTLQNCDPGQITEDTVIAAVNNPVFTTLTVADIEKNLEGSIRFVTGVQKVTALTIRIFGPAETLQKLIEVPEGCELATEECSRLQKNLGWAISAQAGNTEDCNAAVDVKNCQIIKDKTLVIKDVIPPEFNPPLVGGEIFSFQATGSDPDAAATIDLVTDLPLTASDNGETVGVTCYINDDAGQTMMPVSVPLGTSTAQCDTDPDSSPQQNVNTWTGFVLVQDNEAPVISIPAAELIVAPDDASGAVVNYLGKGVWDNPDAEITVSDNIFKDGYPYPALSCEPASGTLFGLGAATTVTCTAIDAGPCDPDSNTSCVVDAEFPDGHNVTTASFTVSVQDLAAPTFDDVDADGFLPDVGPREAKAVDTPVPLNPPAVTDDIDNSPATTFSPAQDVDPPVFPLGTTVITWTATDFAGNESTAQQRVIVEDTTNPGVTVTFPDGTSQVTYSQDGKAVNFDVDIDDIFPDASTIACETAPGSPVSSGDLFPVGDTTVTCTAMDTSENEGTGTATVTIVFEYLASGITGKTSGKTGSSFPMQWAWTDDSGTPLTISEQLLSIERGTCPGNGLNAQDPGSSGLRQDVDGSYLYNLQAVNPDTGEDLFAERPSTPYCFTVSLPTGESQDLTIELRP